MAAQSPICNFGWPAVDFHLAGVDGKKYTLDDVCGEKGTLIAFICNHCPYVKAIIGRLVRDASELVGHGIGTVAIMPNDTVNYPEDSFENMERFAALHGFTFPYLIDEDQSVARAYGAVCTPDLFGFNYVRELQYRGRIDRAGMKPPQAGDARELYNAMLQIAESQRGPSEQFASIGCSIKWKA